MASAPGLLGARIDFLVRVRKDLSSQIIQYLSDGSALIELTAQHNGRRLGKLRLREIRAEGIGRGGKRFELRLWTTLVDAQRHAAEALARGYAERWEQELYFRGLKLDVRSSPLLGSHTVETAPQEIAAVVLGSAVIARLRIAASDALNVPRSRMSFLKLLHASQELWTAISIMDAVRDQSLTAEQRQRAFQEYLRIVRYAILPPRRARSCPRVLRQPVTKWPRKIAQPCYTGEVQIKVVRL